MALNYFLELEKYPFRSTGTRKSGSSHVYFSFDFDEPWWIIHPRERTKTKSILFLSFLMFFASFFLSHWRFLLEQKVEIQYFRLFSVLNEIRIVDLIIFQMIFLTVWLSSTYFDFHRVELLQLELEEDSLSLEYNRTKWLEAKFSKSIFDSRVSRCLSMN